MSLTSIVAVGLDGAIGVKNRLPWKLRSDLRFFKRTTKDNVIILGRKTFESVGGCLPHRKNIVLSHTPRLFPENESCCHVHSVAETLSLRETWPGKEAYVIGGAQIYQQFAPLVDRYLVTVVHGRFPDADAFFDEGVFGSEDVWERSEVVVERFDEPSSDEFDFQVFEFKHKNAEQISSRREKIVTEFRAKNHFYRRRADIQAVRDGKCVEELRRFA